MIRLGYEQLQETLGNDCFAGERVGPLEQFIGNAIPGNLRETSALGWQLAELRAEGAGRTFDTLRCRLLSTDHDAVLGALAELQVLRTLRGRGVPVRMVNADRPRKSADLTIDGDPPTDIEVSYLSVGSAWRLAEQLRFRLEASLTRLAHECGLFVQVHCDGFAGELLWHVDEAVEKFRVQTRRSPRWVESLAPGLVFTVEACSPGWVLVSGATIRSADPFGNESLLTRLPAKIAEEALQVSTRGIVFIRTSELSSALTQLGEFVDLLGALVGRIMDVGSRAANVSAFVVLDEMGTEKLDPIPIPPAPATFSQAIGEETRQRLLWVPNPHATLTPDSRWHEWFKLPF